LSFVIPYEKRKQPERRLAADTEEENADFRRRDADFH